MKPGERKFFLRNLAFYSLGDSLWGFLTNLTAPSVVLVFLLYKAGASSSMIGSISAIETGGLLLPQFFGVYLFRSIARRKLQLAYWHWFVILPFMLLMSLLTFFAGRVSPPLYRWGMLLCFAGYSITVGIAIAVWVEHFIGYVFRPEVRGTVMGLAAFGFSLAGMGGALFAGWLIERMPYPNSYGLLYLIGVVIGVVSFVFFLSVRDPQPYPPEAQTERVNLMDMIHTASASLRSVNFRNFLIGRTLMVIGFCIIPFIAIHYASAAGGSLPASVVVSSYAAMTFSSAIGNLILGRLGDIHGHRLGLIIGVVVQIIALLVLLFLPGWLGCILAYSGAGIISAAGVAPSYTLILETCPHSKRVQHISIANFLIGVPAALAPVVAGWAAESIGLRYLFAICLVISLAALGWLVRFFKEPRRLVETAEDEITLPD